MKQFTHIIGVDPSGAFYEGKGTTGLVLWNCVDGYMQAHKTINAARYDRDVDYWQAHLDAINNWCRNRNAVGIAIEDYMLYGHKAAEQINSRMETCQLIGILKLYLADKGIPYRMQPAALIKPRWPDHILIYKHYWKQADKHISKHELDALRHAVHAAEFYNKGDDEAWLGRMIPTA